MQSAVIIGCGDVGGRLAARLITRGVVVSALARSGSSAERLRSRGIAPFGGDLDRPGSVQGLPCRGRVVFYLAPPAGENGDQRMSAFLAGLGSDNRPERIVYISTSGVYGDRRGEWVDEDTPPNPQTARARRRLNAERQLQGYGEREGVPVVILRVGGIYGPDRLPLERLRRGEPVLRLEEAPWSNRIHVDDLVSALIAAAERGAAGAVYNISDGHNGTMTEYFLAVADAFGIPRPPQITLEEARRVLSPAMLSYLTESRRMDNRRMREELGVEPAYPTLEAGLAAISAGSEE